MQAKDVMTRDVLTIAPEASIVQAVRLMLQKRISGVPVVDAAGSIVGMVTEGDFLRRSETETQRRRPRWLEFLIGPGRLANEYAHASARKVAEVMTAEVHCATEDAPLEEVVHLMERHRIKRVPVLRGNQLVGIVTRRDLVRALADRSQEEQVSPDDTAIRERLLAELKKQHWIKLAMIDIAVTNGVVEFSGMLTDERQRHALRIAAENVPGVKKVNDERIWIEEVSEML
jgi:CBS domain-containing protein